MHKKKRGYYDEDKARSAQIPIRKKFHDPGILLQSRWPKAKQLLRKDARCKQSMVERRVDPRKQRCTVVYLNAEERWIESTAYSALERAILDRIKGWETKVMRRLFRFKRKEGERDQTIMEKEVNWKTPWDEGAEVESPKRKVIRVESEETQDYVRESLTLSREEAEEISFVPSALSIPRGPMFWCDNRCSGKVLRFGKFASIVVDDVKESYTVNLCQQYYNGRFRAQGQASLKSWQWKAVVEKKAHRGRLWKMLGKDQFTQGMWECVSLERAKAKKFLKDDEKEKQEGEKGQWQQESLAKEFLDQVKSCADTHCNPRMMRFGYCALKD